MSRATKDTIQKILIIALSALTVSMVCISFINDHNSNQNDQYFDNEKNLVVEELKVIIHNYDHLANNLDQNSVEIAVEKKKAEELLDNLRGTTLDYETVIEYRKKMLKLRKSNLKIQQKLHRGMSSGAINTGF